MLTIAAAVVLALAVCPIAALADDAEDLTAGGITVQADSELAPMYRLYNPWSGEHFYTADAAECDGLVYEGWDYEGVGWVAPVAGDPVYRLYNPFAGDHHYTLDAEERDSLVGGGWSDEGVGWYSDPGMAVPLYREYNPYMDACNHNYTTNKDEHDGLVALGWYDEGEAWYGVVPPDGLDNGDYGDWTPNYGDRSSEGRDGSDKNQSYTVSYYGNYGYNTYLGKLGDGTMESQQFTAGVPQKLSPNAFSKTGYKFAGWNTKYDGTGVSYADCQEVVDIAPANSSITLYAQWTTANRPLVAIDGGGNGDDGDHKYGGGGVRQDGGTNLYTVTAYSNLNMQQLGDVTFEAQDVTPQAYREMFDAMGVSRKAPVITNRTEEYMANEYYQSGMCMPLNYTEQERDTNPLTRIKVEMTTGAGVRVLKIKLLYKGEVVDYSYAICVSDTADREHSKDDLKLYADVRHKVEAKLWTEDMSNKEKLNVIANYICATTHYPGQDATSKEANPEYFDRWAIDGFRLYYYAANDTLLNRIMRFQGGITTCQASDTIEIVAMEDLGLPYLYSRSTDTVAEGEGVWIGVGDASTAPYNPAHETCYYKDKDENVYAFDAQGLYSVCKQHHCENYIVSLKD